MKNIVKNSLVKRIGAENPKQGDKIVVIGGTHQKEESHSILSIRKAFSRRREEDFIIFLKKYGFQVVIFSYPQELAVEGLSMEKQKEVRREFKLKIIKEEGSDIILTVHNNHWADSAEYYVLAGEYGDDGTLIIPDSGKMCLNPAPLRLDPETQKQTKLYDPILMIFSEGKDPEIDIDNALRVHSMIPACIVTIKQELWKEAKLRNSFCLELPNFREKCYNQDMKKIVEYGKKVLQDIIKCIVRHILKLPQTPEKIALVSGKEKPLAWYKGKKYIKPPPLRFFR